MNPRDLPIYAVEQRIVAAARTDRRLIFQAPTGSGKSTQVPQILLDHGLAGEGQIVILQPRRIAARMLAARVAAERGVQLGTAVGYQVRFDDHSSRATRIKFETEGILLRQMLGNPSIPHVSTIVFDEFHERHLYTDLTLGRALQVQASLRPDLRIVVMSATLDTDALERLLRPCAVLRSTGRMFPVTHEYLPPARPAKPPPPWDLAVAAFARIAPQYPDGHVLIFMPGAYEIAQTVQRLHAASAARGWTVAPLHGELPAEQQDAAVAPSERPKVIVATNVAETSLTIDGVRAVIDSGLARVARFDPYRGINMLLVERISRAAAEQRAGRAGRTSPGLCVRLWTDAEQLDRPLREVPEIRRIDLAETLLLLKASGVDDLATFPWIDPPEAQAVAQATGVLTDLQALDPDTGALTALGRSMAAFPVHPRYSRMLLAARKFDCVPSAALVAALTQDRSLLIRRPGAMADERRNLEFGEEETSDFFLLMRAYRYAAEAGFDLRRCQTLGIHAAAARQVQRTCSYFLGLAREQQGSEQSLQVVPSAEDSAALRKCILLGFSDRVAKRLDASTLRCGLVHNRAGTLARESVVRKSDLLVAAEVREVAVRKGDLQVLLSLATTVEPEWLEELFPGAVREDTTAFWDAGAKRVAAQRRTVFRGLELASRRAPDPAPEAAAPILAAEVLRGRATLIRWDQAVDQWILRVNFLARACPDLGIPTIGDEDRQQIVERICLGAYSVRDLKDKPVWPAVRACLSGAQQALVERHAPERIELPSGWKARLTYGPETGPTMAARIQDLYGVQESPRVALGRVPVTVQILAPNQRPVQITQDLAAFWRERYPQVKKELQRKYPKHEWR